MLYLSHGWIVSGSMPGLGLILWVISGPSLDQDCCSVCCYEAEKIVELKSLTLGHWSHYYNVCCYVAALENCAKGVWVHVLKDSSGPGYAQLCISGSCKEKRCPRSPHPPVLSSKTALINILESLLHDWELLKDRSSSDPSVFMNSLSLTMLRIPAMSLLQVPC